MPKTPSLEDLRASLKAATDRAITAEDDSVKAAVLLAAAAAREYMPEAKRINLGESDQGDWLRVSDVDGVDGIDEGLADYLDDAARTMYLPALNAAPALHEAHTARQPYYIDIAEALGE